jgi:uncharacterized protein (TIGR02598 family)
MTTSPTISMATRMNPLRAGKAAGFSLVETVIALGIMGLAVTALLGLLPHGMAMSKQAANAGAESRILDTLRSELGNFSFSGLSAVNKKRLAFDEEGMLLSSSASAVRISYIAEVTSASSGEQPIALPGAPAAERLLRNFLVKIAPSPNNEFDFTTAAPASYRALPLHFGPTIP